MEALKLKIFEALTGKIPVTGFEKWIYDCEEVLNKIDNNSFVFEVVSMNYKTKFWQIRLIQLIEKYLKTEEFMMFIAGTTFYKLINSKTIKETHSALKYFMNYFDYNSDSFVLNELYHLHSDYDLYEIGVYAEDEFNHMVCHVSEDALKHYNSCESYHEKLRFTNKKSEVNQTQNISKKPSNKSFKQKFLAFFKKI